MPREKEDTVNKKGANYATVLNSILMVAGIAMLGVIVVVITRFQRGLLAIVLSALAGALLIFWLFELKKIFRQNTNPFDNQKRRWTYDLIPTSDAIIFVAEVPGPDSSVSVELKKGKLRVKSSGDFAKEIELADPVEIIGSTCVNGILNVRLRKISEQNS
ncbi:MAG: Hsp20/alpha crystallin family protein [Thaumarchaeota archaeon]|nr:Hsp20/alpha crystallin family protein [Nitrososphaerota archaeon]